MKKIQVILREVDETGKTISDQVVSEIEPITIASSEMLSEAGKLAWLNKVEQNAVDAAATLKKTSQLSKCNTKKST